MVGWVGDSRDTYCNISVLMLMLPAMWTLRDQLVAFTPEYDDQTHRFQSLLSKRQSCVSHSSLEAEIVASDLGLRTYGLSSISLWRVL